MIVSALLAKDEAERDLRNVLSNALAYADQVLLLDDNSRDGTGDIARAMGVTVRRRHSKTAAWGKESSARRELWTWAAEVAGDGWVMIQDCDMVLVGDPRPLTGSWLVNAFAFVLYDVWGEGVYREDAFWQAHWHPRPWLFCPSRVPPGWVAEWSGRGIHTGHAPANFPLRAAALDPDVLHWLHFAYSTPERRQIKFEQYRSQSEHLSPFERQHAASILDYDR